jgi:hypothetical protein
MVSDDTSSVWIIGAFESACGCSNGIVKVSLSNVTVSTSYRLLEDRNDNSSFVGKALGWTADRVGADSRPDLDNEDRQCGDLGQA